MSTTTISTGRKAFIGLLAGLIAGFVLNLLVTPTLDMDLHLLIGAGLGLLFGISVAPAFIQQERV